MQIITKFIINVAHFVYWFSCYPEEEDWRFPPVKFLPNLRFYNGIVKYHIHNLTMAKFFCSYLHKSVKILKISDTCLKKLCELENFPKNNFVEKLIIFLYRTLEPNIYTSKLNFFFFFYKIKDFFKNLH